GAISIAPILLVKAGMLNGKAFMIGADKEGLLEEGYSETDLKSMKDWSECISHPIEEGYVTSGNIVTSVSFEFVRFAIQFCKMVGIEISPKNFGL
ncbi:MAG: glutamine amidotransferase, partial [Tissierellia bacterium]|nr:glutamine amidotransferase [Tissierellia bacterium]